MTDYVPEYSETSSVGKRMLLLPDEVLRFPIDQMLLIENEIFHNGNMHHHCSTPFTTMLLNQLGRGLTICVEVVFRKTRN